MSGVEVVGLVFGALPLIALATDNYKKAFAPFRRYVKYDVELKALEGRLITQKTIYQEEAQFLLKNALGRNLARELFSDLSSASWEDQAFQTQFNDYLGSSVEAVSIVIRSIESILGRICGEVRRLTEATKKQDSQPQNEKSRKRNFAKKLSFGFSESRFEVELDKLSERNLEFQTLVKQVARKGKQDGRVYERRRQHRTSNYDIKPYILVQEESKLLYDTLRDACIHHNNHKAHFNLAPQVEPGAPLRISFEVTFQRPMFTQQPNGGHPNTFKLVIESSKATGFCQKNSVVQNAQMRCKRQLSPNIELGPLLNNDEVNTTVQRKNADSSGSFFDTVLHNVKRKKKTVSFQARDDEQEQKQAMTISCAVNPRLPGFLEQNNLCDYIRTQFQLLVSEPKICVGFLEKQPQHQLAFFLTGPQQTRPCSLDPWYPDPLSLRNILDLIKTRRQAGRLSEHERYRFARLLATAALNFHDTPWMKQGSWRSSDIYLGDFFLRSNENLPQLTVPCMDVAVRRTTEAPLRRSTDDTRPWIPNPLLFGLALVLIELALEQPLDKLQIDSDAKHCFSAMDVEYKTATRLLPIVGGSTSPSYERIVGDCLRNFGSGDSLSDKDMQRLYHEKVICELLDLERHFARFCLVDCDCQTIE